MTPEECDILHKALQASVHVVDETEDSLSGSYHDSMTFEKLKATINDQVELDRLNEYRKETRSMESFNRIIRKAIHLQKHGRF